MEVAVAGGAAVGVAAVVGVEGEVAAAAAAAVDDGAAGEAAREKLEASTEEEGHGKGLERHGESWGRENDRVAWGPVEHQLVPKDLGHS